MSYNYEFPYVDPNRHNSDWEINKVKELDARVTAAEKEIADFESAMKADWADYQDKINNQIDDFTGGMISQWNAYKAQLGTDWANYQQSINAQWAQYKTDTDADIASWKAGAIGDLDAWKTATTADLATWKQQANTDIANWEAATSASLDADFAQYRQTTDSAITAWESATSANLNKLMDDYKALINGEWAQYKTDTDADIAAFKSSVNVSLSGMDNRITAMQTAITTLQSDWATFQTTIQGDITTFENNVNSALSSMRQDMADFETDINAKISTQNAQIASMQTAVNNIPTSVNTAVDNKFNSLTPPYSSVGVMWQNYHSYVGKRYQGITGDVTGILCGTIPQAMQDAVELELGITINNYVYASNYSGIINALNGSSMLNVVFIGNDFNGGEHRSYINSKKPMIVVGWGQSNNRPMAFLHAMMALSSANDFFMYDTSGLRYGNETLSSTIIQSGYTVAYVRVQLGRGEVRITANVPPSGMTFDGLWLSTALTRLVVGYRWPNAVFAGLLVAWSANNSLTLTPTDATANVYTDAIFGLDYV